MPIHIPSQAIGEGSRDVRVEGNEPRAKDSKPRAKRAKPRVEGRKSKVKGSEGDGAEDSESMAERSINLDDLQDIDYVGSDVEPIVEKPELGTTEAEPRVVKVDSRIEGVEPRIEPFEPRADEGKN